MCVCVCVCVCVLGCQWGILCIRCSISEHINSHFPVTTLSYGATF